MPLNELRNTLLFIALAGLISLLAACGNRVAPTSEPQVGATLTRTELPTSPQTPTLSSSPTSTVTQAPATDTPTPTPAQVGQTPLPDLAIKQYPKVVFNPGTCGWVGGQITVSFDNLGLADAGPFTVSVEGQRVGLNGLPAGSSDEATVPFEHVLGGITAWLDSTDAVTESDETNNFIGATFTPPPTCTSTPTPTPSLPPTETATPILTPTFSSSPPTGYLTFPSRYGDAGNFALQAGATITLTWHKPPLDANRYDFIVRPYDDKAHPLVIGSDADPTDGVAIAWAVPENLGGELRAEAHFTDGRVIYSAWAGDIYTGQAPPEGVCSLSSASIGVLDVFREPDLASENFAYITPGPYAQVLERTAGGWYHIDTNIAESRDNQETIPETGWVYREQGIDLHGDCDNVPLDSVITLTPAPASVQTGAEEPWVDYIIATDGLIESHTNPHFPLSPGSPAPSALWQTEATNGTYIYRTYYGDCTGDGRYRHCVGGINIVDATDATTIVGSYSAPSIVTGILVSDNLAYVTWRAADILGHGGLVILDVSEPTRPVAVGDHQTFPWATGLLLHPPYAYLLTYSGVEVVDVSQPEQPVLVGTYQLPSNYPSHAALAGDRLYLLTATRQMASCPPDCGRSLRILDVSQPTAPVEIWAYELPLEYQGGTTAQAMAMIESNLYVPGSDNAWLVFQPDRLLEPALPSPPPDVALPLLAWTISPDDGALFVMDATVTIYQLDPVTLSLLHKVPASFSAPVQTEPFVPSVNLLVSRDYLFVGNRVLSQTQVLNRTDFSEVTRLNQAGLMALDPGQRLLLIPHIDNGLVSYDLTSLNHPPHQAIPARNQGIVWDRINLRGLTVDPLNRHLYVAIGGRPGSHPCGSYERYNLDTFAYLDSLGGLCYGGVGTMSLSPEAGLIVGVENSTSGPLKSSLKLFNRQGEELKSISPFAGQAVIDPAGNWLYVLRPSGLWVLDAHDLTLPAALPFLDTPPGDLALSPDGQILYLFGNGWLTALDTADFRTGRLKALPLTPPGPRPDQPFCTECGNLLRVHIPAYFYPSPQMAQDQTAFVQHQWEDYGHIYRTTDGGQSWSFLPGLSYPDFKQGGQLSLSPDFARDQTLVAYTVRRGLDRSLDGGATWTDWSPPIAFVSDRGGNRELYLMNKEGGDVRRLTDHPAADENPAWSPAWTRLAFQSNRYGNWDIFSIRADCLPELDETGPECDLRQLTTDPADDMLPAWSPDGRSMAFVSTRDGNPEIYVMDKDGQNQRRLTFNPAGDWRPTWFGDARRLAFTSDRSGNNDIYQLTVPTATLTIKPEVVPLVTHPADDRDPAIYSWGEDELLFLSDREGINRAYKLNLRSNFAKPWPLTSNQQPVSHPAWNELSSRSLLIAVEQNGQSDIYSGQDQFDTLLPLTDSPTFDGQPAWGPTRWLPTAATNQAWLNRGTQ